MAGKPVPIITRLLSKRRITPAGCWEWTACLTRGGYGQVRGPHGKNMVAHKAMYEATVGPIRPGLDLDHLCRNRRCINPAHLEPVTRLENVRRGEVWKINGAKTHCPQGHPYSGENLYRLKGNRRDCRACRNDASRRRRAIKHIPMEANLAI